MADNSNSALDKEGGAIRSRLADLEKEFNTNPGFGFKGMMAEQDRLQREANQSAPPEREAPAAAKEEETVPNWVAPVQTSIHSIKQEFQQGLGALKAEIDQLRPAQQEQTDPNMPPEVAPVYQRLGQVNRDFQTLALRQEEQRARDALRDARGRYKDFSFSDEDLRSAWRQHIGENVNAAAKINWDHYFRAQYESQANPRLMSENEKLKIEIERLKSGGRNQVEDLTAVPHANRQSVAASQLAETSRNDDFDEELYQRAKARVSKGIFRGFNRALAEEQNKMRRIRTA